jgi:hypothetical protein
VEKDLRPGDPWWGFLACFRKVRDSRPLQDPRCRDPNPPESTCGAVELETGRRTAESGIFEDQYSLGSSVSPACSITSAQSFTVTYNGQSYNIRTRYNVTWRNSGGAATCTAGCR